MQCISFYILHRDEKEITLATPRTGEKEVFHIDDNDT